MISLRKAETETPEQYIWRICKAKDTGSIEADWEDIAGVLNRELFGDDKSLYYGESTYRKQYQNAKRFYDAGVFDSITDTNHIKELKKQQEEIIKEKRKLYDQRREYNKLLTSDARADHLSDELLKVAHKLEKELPLRGSYYLVPNNAHKEALLCLSDWHYGLVTDNLWNHYDVETCKQRVDQLSAYVSKYLAENHISTVHIVMLGDAAHGAIHTSCRVQAEENVCDQLMHVSELIAEFIDFISEGVSEVNVYSCYGNHMRTIQNIHDSIHSDNMEKIIPWWLKTRLVNNPKVTIKESEFKEFTKLNILGKNICCVHGDLDNFRDLGVTVNTIFSKLYGETIDYTISGDKHHLEEFEQYGIESILVRSLCGTDDYANNKRLYGKAGQTLIIFNDDYGREATYHIPLN